MVFSKSHFLQILIEFAAVKANSKQPIELNLKWYLYK